MLLDEITLKNPPTKSEEGQRTYLYLILDALVNKMEER